MHHDQSTGLGVLLPLCYPWAMSQHDDEPHDRIHAFLRQHDELVDGADEAARPPSRAPHSNTAALRVLPIVFAVVVVVSGAYALASKEPKFTSADGEEPYSGFALKCKAANLLGGKMSWYYTPKQDTKITCRSTMDARASCSWHNTHSTTHTCAFRLDEDKSITSATYTAFTFCTHGLTF